MENNPWSKKLKKTGLIEQRLLQEQIEINNLNERQNELQDKILDNINKVEKYEERKISLAVDASYTLKGIEKLEEEKRIQKQQKIQKE